MKRFRTTRILVTVMSMGAGLAACTDDTQDPAPPLVTPSNMARVGMIDERFLSYNISMREVTGGLFWKSYESDLTPAPTMPARVTGNDPGLYRYRGPADLSGDKLRMLARALGPAYVRVSGAAANSTYYARGDMAPDHVPEGFDAILTRQQWRGVIEFAKSVDANIVTSFAISSGTRDANGVWNPDLARWFLEDTRVQGGQIAAAAFMHEPTGAATGGAPAGYDAEAYGRDVKLFRTFLRETEPDIRVLGPDSMGETPGFWKIQFGDQPILKTSDLLAASGRAVDVFTYHHYGAASKRCAAAGMPQTTLQAAMSEEWLGRTGETLRYYKNLRNQYEPGKPIWLTETADAACGGNPWASGFVDSFRFLDQLGRLARSGVDAVFHMSLMNSDYGLLDEETFQPNPNYWAALLWRRLMGMIVLDASVPRETGLHVYAHCQRGKPGGVALLVINNDRGNVHALSLPTASERYTLSANTLEERTVRLNGNVLQLDNNNQIPALEGSAALPGTLSFAPATLTFLAIPAAGNGTC